MKTFLVFAPDGSRDAAAADRVILLREKFSWVALFFTFVWLLWHRLWLALLGWIAAILAIAILALVFGIDGRAATLLMLLPSILIAFEATELRRRKLLRRGYREAAVMVAADRDDAERRFFAGWLPMPTAGPYPAASPSPAPAPVAPGRPENPGPRPVIGLFPEPGGGR